MTSFYELLELTGLKVVQKNEHCYNAIFEIEVGRRKKTSTVEHDYFWESSRLHVTLKRQCFVK